MKIGDPTFHFQSLGSTNDYAHYLLSKKDVVEGTVVSTDHQTAGRGQQNKSWEVVAGENVTMSIVLTPTWLEIKDQFALNVIASLTVHNVLSKYVKNVTIKWPNDIYVHDRKIAGILIKNQLQGSTIRNSIMGLGVNINQKQWPKDVKYATSLCAEIKKISDVAAIRDEICQTLQLEYFKYKVASTASWLKYRQLLFRKGILSAFEVAEGLKKGTIIDVADDGRLIIDFGGDEERFSHGEVIMII